MVRRARLISAAAPWPARREDVPSWLEAQYQVAAVGNRLNPGALQPDPELPGLTEARAAAVDYVLRRGAPELREQALHALEDPRPEVAPALWRRSLKADLAATRGELTQAERKELLVRFVRAFRDANRRRAAGADLPLRALLAVAWWEGYRRAPPTRNSVRDLERLLERRP